MLRTARQRKEICKDCPVARTADLLGDSFSILIVRDLLVKPRRFGDLERSLSGVSSRTLSNKLKMLEEELLIARTEYKTHPPKVEYRLTRKGEAFHGVVDAMRAYGKKYLS
jgi:DNA-binding HxlR family transcriptional regulator